MASFLYNYFKGEVMKGDTELDGGSTLYLMLLQSTYTTQTAATISGVADFRADVYAYEVTAGGTTGYTTGGQTMGTTSVNTVSVDMTTNNLAYWDSADLSWGSAYITARYAVIYRSTGNSATDPLVCCFDFGSDQTATNGTFTIQWSSAGLIRLS